MRKNSSAYIEMLFENRNKAYGAYDLRVNYEKRLMKSFGMALLIAGLFFLIPFVLTKILTRIHEEKKKDVPPMVYNLGQKFVIEKDKLAFQHTASRTKVVSKDLYKVVKDDVVRKDDGKIKPDDPATPLQGAVIGTTSDSTFSDEIVSGNVDSVSAPTYSAASVDVIPAFPGGEDAMLKFLQDQLRYPPGAHAENITGRVYVSFVIDENGKVTDIHIMRGLGYGTEDEVKRVVGIMPDWTPGKYQGRNVKTAFVMPVLFSLK